MPAPAYTGSFIIAEIDMVEDPKTGQLMKHRKFESVSRLKGIATDKSKAELILDFNSDIYPLQDKDVVCVTIGQAFANLCDSENSGLLTSALVTLNTSYPFWQIVVALAANDDGGSLFDDYEYVMHGRLFKYGEGADKSQISLFASFGGLMLQLNISPKVLSPQTFSVNDQLYILIKKGP